LEDRCLGNGMYCAYESVMDKYISAEDGKDLLLLSLTMQCLAEASKTPVKTFFNFITHFYEKGCMVAADEAYADSGHVKIKRSCVDKLLTVFT